MNLLLVIGQTLCLQAVRRIRERKGDEGFFSQAAGENYENYYPIWAEQKTKQEKRLNTAALLLLIAAGLFVAVHMYLHSAYFYMNYAFFYLLPLTILLQYVVCGRTFARQAQENAEENGFSDRMHIVCGDLRQAHTQIAPGNFDCVISNPPYYPPESGYLHAQDSLSAARSELCCPFDALCAAAARALRWGGRFFLVHKPERLVDLLTGLRTARLEPKRICFVRHRAESGVNLVLIEARLGGKPGLQYEPDLILYAQTGELSAEGRRIYHLQE